MAIVVALVVNDATVVVVVNVGGHVDDIEGGVVVIVIVVGGHVEDTDSGVLLSSSTLVVEWWWWVSSSRCHAPNRFGTVNMEDNVNIKRS